MDNALMKKIDQSKDDLTERLIHMTASMQSHIEADAIAFQALNADVKEVNKDVKSLLASRSFLRGTWFAVVTVGTLIGVVAGLVAAWWK